MMGSLFCFWVISLSAQWTGSGQPKTGQTGSRNDRD